MKVQGNRMGISHTGKNRAGTVCLLLCMLITLFFVYGQRENITKINIFHITLPFVPLYGILVLTAVFFLYALFVKGKKIDVICVLLAARMVLHCIPLLSTGIHAKFAVNFVTSGLCLVFYWLGLNFSRDERFLVRVVKLIFFLVCIQTVAESLLGPVSFLGYTYDYKNDLILPLGGSNAIAALLIPCFAFLFCTEKKAIFCVLDVAVLLGTIALTKSRGGLIIALLAICLAVLFRMRLSLKKILIVGVVGCSCIALVLAVLLMTSWGQYIFLNSTSTVYGRFDLWAMHLQYFTERPIFGYGFAEQTVTNNPHNVFIHLLSRSGIVGLELASIGVAVTINKLKGTLRDRYVKAGLCFLICMLLHSMVEIVLFSYTYDIIFWFILGSTVMRAATVRDAKPETAPVYPTAGTTGADVLILNYNDAETTMTAVNALKDYESVGKIVVVDNKSTDDSLEVLHQSYDGNEKIDIVSAPKNGGYGSGNNVGIRYLREQYGSKYILLANPDTLIDEETLVMLATFLKENPDYAVAAPFMCNPKGEKQYNSAFRIPSCFRYVMAFEMFFSKLVRPNFYRGLEKTDAECLTVDGVSGSLFMLDAEAMAEYGMFDENVFLYAEEIILSMKLRAAGKKIALLPRLNFIHNHSVSISKTFRSEVKKQELCLTSQLYVVKEYYKANGIMRLFARMMAKISLLEHKLYYKIRKKG